MVYLLYFRRRPKSDRGSDAEGDYGRDLTGEQAAPEESSLMGPSREDEGVGSLGMHELEFSAPGFDTDASGTGPDHSELDAQSDSPFADPKPGSLELLTSQLKDSLAGFSEAGENSKPVLVATLAGILREHPELVESDLLESVLLLLCDYAQEAELPYSISVEELRAALEV